MNFSPGTKIDFAARIFLKSSLSSLLRPNAT